MKVEDESPLPSRGAPPRGSSGLRAALLLVALLVSCTPGNDCFLRAHPVTGDLAADVVGTWRWETNEAHAETFERDGGYASFAPPNGVRTFGSWWVGDAGTLFYEQRYVSASVTDAGLTIDGQLKQPVACVVF